MSRGGGRHGGRLQRRPLRPRRDPEDRAQVPVPAAGPSAGCTRGWCAHGALQMIVPVVGITPGRRYGHSAVFSKPHLLVFGGNTGSEAVNDVWCLNVERAPFSWARLDVNGDQPAVRVYHSAALCEQGSATGMMVIFGGRTSD